MKVGTIKVLWKFIYILVRKRKLVSIVCKRGVVRFSYCYQNETNCENTITDGTDFSNDEENLYYNTVA